MFQPQGVMTKETHSAHQAAKTGPFVAGSVSHGKADPVLPECTRASAEPPPSLSSQQLQCAGWCVSCLLRRCHITSLPQTAADTPLLFAAGPGRPTVGPDQQPVSRRHAHSSPS